MVIYPLVNIEKTIENGDLVVDFPMKNGTIFHSYVNVYQRVWGRMAHVIFFEMSLEVWILATYLKGFLKN